MAHKRRKSTRSIHNSVDCFVLGLSTFRSVFVHILLQNKTLNQEKLAEAETSKY